MAIIDNSYIKATLEFSNEYNDNLEFIKEIGNKLTNLQITPKIYQKKSSRWVFEYGEKDIYPNYYLEVNVGDGCVWCIKKSEDDVYINSSRNIYLGTDAFIKDVKEKVLCEH